MVLHRYFTRYGNPHYAQDNNMEFANLFSTTIAPSLLEQVMRMLALRPSGQYCTDRVVHSCVSFVNSAIELSNLYKLLKPHLVSNTSPQCNTYDIRSRTTGATAVYYL
eukprot:13943-Heterococcus_DN1.PRE.1